MLRYRKAPAPKFRVVHHVLGSRLEGVDSVTWTDRGEYFVGPEVHPGAAVRVVDLAGKIGVKLTPAGAPLTGGHDLLDSDIRIAPSRSFRCSDFGSCTLDEGSRLN